MKHQTVVIFFSLLIAACASKRKFVESPLFNKSLPPETKEEIESLPKVTQSEVIEKISPAPVKPAPQPRTVLTANRKAPPPSPVVATAATAADIQENEESQDYLIYVAKGGESLSFVAKSLLGSPQKTSLLKNWNPILASGPLKKEQEIKVKIEVLKPQPIYLTRSLITKYKTQLRGRLARNSPQKTYVVKNGETLQTISQKLYATTRRWTELYLLNYDKMQDPDILEKGTELKHY